ncbi:MAG: TonB-dependent receptor [Chitinophagaceae bacterium]
MKLFISIILYLFFSIVLGCSQFKVNAQVRQKISLSGIVTDSLTGSPLQGASVTATEARIGTSTDSTGRYVINNIPPGHLIIEVSHTGYRTVAVHIDIRENFEKNFALTSVIIENEGVTVMGVAGATTIRRSPVPVTRVSKGELLATSSTNIIDALTREPGVSQISSGPAVSKPIIRGLGYNRLVVINDGIRQEGQQWGDEHGVEIDENSVYRVEVLKGPASLIYGSDAIAGVINIITTSPIPNNTLRGSILSSYYTNNKQRSLFGNFGGNINGFNWNAWGDYKAAADYKNKYDGRVYNSKYNEKNFGGYAGVNGSWGFTHLILSNFNQRVGVIEGERDHDGNFIKFLPGGETKPTKSDFNSTKPQVPYQHIKHFKVTSDNSFNTGTGRISLILALQRNQRIEFGNPGDPEEKSLHFDLKTFNYNTAYHFGDRSGWRTAFGINGMRQQNENRGVEVLIPEYKLFDIGTFLYSQKTINFITLSGGIRYDVRSLTSDELREGSDIKFVGFDKKFSNISGSAGLSAAVGRILTLRLNAARGFRAPSIPELSSNGAHEGTNRYEFGEQNLKSEISFQLDAGFEISSEHLLLSATPFYNRVNNFIFYRKLESVSGGDSTVDVGGDLIPAFKFDQQNATLSGAEFSLDFHPHPFDWLHIENSYSFVNGRFANEIDGTRNGPFIPARRYNGDIKASLLPKGKTFRNVTVHFEVERTFRQKRPFTAYETETATPAYTLLNAGFSTNVVAKNKTIFSVYFNALNLADVAYQNHLSRLKYAAVNNATGRQGVFNVGRNYSFKLNIPLSFPIK